MATSITGSSSTPSTSTTSPQTIDYLGLLGSLSPTPFDPNSVINALLAVKQIPVTNLQTQIKTIQNNESIYKNIAASVASLQASAFNLTLQSTIQANTATSSNPAAVTAVANPNAQVGTYTVAVNALATSTQARSTATLGQSIDTRAAGTPLSSLNLNGTPTAGSFSVIVDGAVKTVNVDPSKALLDPANGALTLLQGAINSAMAPGDAGAAASVTVTGDKVSIGLAGAARTHTISFGSSGDTSNFLALMNLNTVNGTLANAGPAITSSALVGVVQPNATLGGASLNTALTGTPDPGSGAATGSFSINGVSISWNAGVDTLSDVMNRINNSTAGVTAQYDSINDKMILNNKATGQTAISLTDTTGNFLAAMNLAPGTTTAQMLGTNASVTVNGSTLTSTNNTISNAVPGLSITALTTTPLGTPATLTVGSDVTGITKQVQGFVDAANKVLSDINLTQQKDAASGQYSQLLGDTALLALRNQIMNMVTGQVSSSGTYRSLQDIGVTTGAVGIAPSSAPGTALSLTLNTSKLTAALAANPSQVAALFNGTTASNGFQGVAQKLNTYLTQQTNPTRGVFGLYQAKGDTQVKSMQAQIAFLQRMIDAQRQVLTTRFSAMSTALAAMTAQTAALSTVGGGSGSSSGH